MPAAVTWAGSAPARRRSPASSRVTAQLVRSRSCQPVASQPALPLAAAPEPAPGAAAPHVALPARPSLVPVAPLAGGSATSNRFSGKAASRARGSLARAAGGRCGRRGCCPGRRRPGDEAARLPGRARGVLSRGTAPRRWSGRGRGRRAAASPGAGVPCSPRTPPPSLRPVGGRAQHWGLGQLPSSIAPRSRTPSPLPAGLPRARAFCPGVFFAQRVSQLVPMLKIPSEAAWEFLRKGSSVCSVFHR